MSKNSTSKVVRYSRDKLPPDKTDWARIDAMTDEEVVAAALSDPDAQPLTPEQLAKMRRVSRVKVLRQRLAMTQAEFAEAFHLPITTLRDWEQHRSTPDAPARALLLAIERGPEVMRRFCNRIGRMELKPTDLILRRREAPSRRMAAGSVSLVAVLRGARNPSRRAPQVGHARLRMRCALLRTRLIDASI
jgi:putative transcriptional regulator